MKYYKILFILLMHLLIVSGCDSRSEIAEGLSYEEYISRAEQYVSKGDADKAISAYLKALKIKPNDAKIHFTLGQLCDTEWKKSYDLAYNKYRLDTFKNVKRSLDLVEDLKKYGLKNEYKEMALHEFNETIKYSPENRLALEYIATDHLNNKRYNDAISGFNKIVKIAPTSSIAYWHLADSYLQVGSYDLAIENITKAFHIDSDAEFYYYSLGKVFMKMNNYEKGFEMLTKLKNMKSAYYDELLTYRYSNKTNNP